MNKARRKSLATAIRQFAQRMDQSILLAYVRLCPLANHINLTSPGLAGLAVIAILPR
jgi:hypothetical protein